MTNKTNHKSGLCECGRLLRLTEDGNVPWHRISLKFFCVGSGKKPKPLGSFSLSEKPNIDL